ncbi:zinc finger A20 and AN1 domain-containing stress-associated protein 5-like [Olea europaea var. sylvestris]|uniref:Zinc finger A20 and AN1 domain-containing stress-associated 8 n=1 Tax=Olea europaea subsp. europaea TaxID=158383 RepID=A0A8S0Q4U4_OLEEU|nr:zinc finger A20 and AN1 domain-containing stress-associated protein 5-like [Olea europaea var. sylvestris]CAA2963002.1 zinc finger A20 and AN1 domain-containing stress-associated 8 [Olea europaea subsp. europaea]
MDQTQSCQQETLQLCSRCQKFYGSPQNHGLCSKCYQDFLKERIAKSAETICFKETSASSSFSPSVSTNSLIDPLVDATNSLTLNNDANPLPIVNNRCKSRNKKVGLTGFGCKCGGSFCGMHRYPEAHACKFDYKTPARAILMKENPVCKGDRLIDRA